MSTPDEPAFDWVQASSLLGDDPDQVSPDMAEIVVELVVSSGERLKELKAMDDTKQHREIASQAHQLRGSLLNFGFTGVGEVLLDIEKSVYPPSDYPGKIEKAQAAFDASKKLLAARFPTLKLS